MARIKLNVTQRDELGSTQNKRLRFTGFVPGIIYGKGKKSIPVKVNLKDIHSISGGHLTENVLLDLTVKGEEKESVKTVIVKEIQKNFIKGDLLHIDFNEISLKERLKTKVAIEVVGEAVGITQGGILDQILHELDIECLPTDIPQRINVDVTSLNIGQTIFVKNLVIPEKVTVLSNPELPVASVAAPKAEEEVVAAPAEGEPTEPEVIGKGKKEEEEEAGPPTAEAKPKEKEKEKEEAKPKEEKSREKPGPAAGGKEK